MIESNTYENKSRVSQALVFFITSFSRFEFVFFYEINMVYERQQITSEGKEKKEKKTQINKKFRKRRRNINK
jgi:hypothetical protein